MTKHLAIFTDQAVKYIFAGEKVIDSRFSLRKIAPFSQIKSGDMVYIKRSGGKIVGQFKVKRVISFDNLSQELIEKIRRDYNSKIKADKYFWSDKKEAKYGTLIFISEVQPVLFPIKVRKKDRRGWVLLDNSKVKTGQSN